MLSVDWVWLKWNEIPDENKIIHVFKIYVFNMLFHFVYIFIIYGWLSPLVLSYQVFRSTCLLGLLCCNIKECLYNFFFGGWGGLYFFLLQHFIEKIFELKDAINNLTLQFSTRNIGKIWRKKYSFFHVKKIIFFVLCEKFCLVMKKKFPTPKSQSVDPLVWVIHMILNILSTVR